MAYGVTLPVLLFLAAMKNCAANPSAPVACEGQLFAEVTTETEHRTGWLCPDYTIHWTTGPVEQHYQCYARHRAVTTYAGHVLMTKD